MRHLDLFSGIGGFALAARMVGSIETTQFVEIDPYCQKVLAKNFPGVPIHDDVTTFTATPGRFDLVTFGSPCQDISCANTNGRGLEGERSGLFYEAIRIIRLVQPRFAVFENVANLLTKDRGIHFQRVLRAFYEGGFDAEWQVISAASVGAPHLRERVFVVAYACRAGRKKLHAAAISAKSRQHSGVSASLDALRNSNSLRLESSSQTHQRWTISELGDRWRTEPSVGRVANGLPNRVDRIRGLGNAVVPQVAAIALQRVLDLEARA